MRTFALGVRVATAATLAAGFAWAATLHAADGTTEAPVLKVPATPSLEPKPLFVPKEYPMRSAAAPGTYQMRCWQKGRLLFSENDLSDPVIAALPGKVAAFGSGGKVVDRSTASVYLIEVSDSLCLIRRR